MDHVLEPLPLQPPLLQPVVKQARLQGTQQTLVLLLVTLPLSLVLVLVPVPELVLALVLAAESNQQVLAVQRLGPFRRCGMCVAWRC